MRQAVEKVSGVHKHGSCKAWCYMVMCGGIGDVGVGGANGNNCGNVLGARNFDNV